MTSIWSQVEIKSIFFEEPSRLAIGSSPFNEDLGQISTQAGPIAASFSLKGLLQLLQSRKTDNLFISGSLQDHGDGLRIVSQLSYGKKSWAWDIDRFEVERYLHKRFTVPNLVTQLAYHVTNRVMGQTSQLIDALPGDHFQKYTELLSKFVDYIQTESPMHDQTISDLGLISNQKSFSLLCAALKAFVSLEPADVRSYYMLYVVGIIAISRREYGRAKKLLLQANAIEPSVLVSILQTGIPLRRLKWKGTIYRQLKTSYSVTNRLSQADRLRAAELAKGLANVNAALGFVIEQQSGGKPLTEDRFLERRLDLEAAENAYKRAFEYKADDPLFLSNQAEVKLRMSDLLQPKDSFLERRLRLRAEAEQLLKKACSMRRSKNVKYAWLRLGNYYVGSEDLIQAIVSFKKAWSLDKSFLVAARNLANVYSMVHDYDLAILTCQKALLEIGSNRSHFLNSQQIHGWIHNCRGWAYLRKARRRRLITAASSDRECESWLQMAENNFEESIHLLSGTKGQPAIPMMNKLFVKLEKNFFKNPPEEFHFLDELTNVFDINSELVNSDSEEAQDTNDFVSLYSKIFRIDPDSFKRLFDHHWSNHTFLPSEYLGFLEDLFMLLEYVELTPKTGSAAKELQYLDKLTVCLRAAINSVSGYLSSCVLGVNLLWYLRFEQSVRCWDKRFKDLCCQDNEATVLLLGSPPESVEDVTTYTLNQELWCYLYSSLSSSFSNQTPVAKNAFPSFDQVLKQDMRSSRTRRYAFDLLREAKSIGEILTRRSPLDIHNTLQKKDPSEIKKLKANLRLLFQPVNKTYYRAARAQWKDWLVDGLKDFWSSFKLHYKGMFARLEEFFKTLMVGWDSRTDR